MQPVLDPFVPTPVGSDAGDSFESLVGRAATQDGRRATAPFDPHLPCLAWLDGFDPLDQPRVRGVPGCPGEIVTARSTVALRRSMIGREVLVTLVQGDPRQPVIVGVVEPRPLETAWPVEARSGEPQASVDGESHVIEAEREIVLRCGDASITLTRAGRVVIQGRYVLSRSSGYNKIKGAAVDIN